MLERPVSQMTYDEKFKYYVEKCTKDPGRYNTFCDVFECPDCPKFQIQCEGLDEYIYAQQNGE